MSLENQIYQAIYKAIDTCLNLIGSVLEGDARRLIIDRDMMAEGDFLANTGYKVDVNRRQAKLTVGSNVKHEPYVLGGKLPSWTPLKPLKAWVERKGLAWVDKKGEPMTVTQMAYLIRGKIKREGIAPATCLPR